MKHILIVFALLFIGCQTKSSDTSKTYFGGEIINPNDNYVVLYKEETVVDSAKLDENNRFLIVLDNPEEGLYYFTHKPEEQYVYLEKGDSLLMRLNTLEFDESLIFSGKGAEINNFLIEMFLVNEDEERLVYDYYKLEPNIFSLKIDSLKAMKQEQLNELLGMVELSNKAEEIARASIDYVSYYHRETYPYMHKKWVKDFDYNTIPEDFFAHRENISLNNENLSYFTPYFKYSILYFNNLSYTDCKKRCKRDVPKKLRSLHFHEHKLHLIDSLVTNQTLRYILFRNAAYSYLFDDHEPENNKRFINTFKTLSKDKRHNKEVYVLYKDIQNLQPGKRLPDLPLFTADSQTTTINNIHNNKTVYYFWSVSQKNHMKNMFKKAAKLQKQFPEYRFVGINFTDAHDRWVQTLKEFNQNPDYHLRGVDSIRKALVFHKLNQAIILDENGTIVDAFADFHSKYLPEKLNPKK